MRKLSSAQQLVFDDRVKVIGPADAENPMQVPITVDATALGSVQEVLVFADFNPILQILRFFPQRASAFSDSASLQQSSPVRAAALTSDGVWHLGGTWINTVGGGCTAPSAASAAPEWQRRLNEVSGRQWTSGPMSGRVRMRIIHPMDTGLVAGIPAFYLEDIEFLDPGRPPPDACAALRAGQRGPVFTLQQECLVECRRLGGTITGIASRLGSSRDAPPVYPSRVVPGGGAGRRSRFRLWPGGSAHSRWRVRIYRPQGGFSTGNGGNIVNTGFIVGSGGVVVDTGPSQRYGKQMRKAIGILTRQPVSLVLNTHHHPDHFLGNQAFADRPVGAFRERGPESSGTATLLPKTCSGWRETGCWERRYAPTVEVSEGCARSAAAA